MAFDRAKFLTRFIEEAREHISQLNAGLLVIEKNPDDTDQLNAVFRSAHTIKGSARMMKLGPVSHVAHTLEDTLDALRQQKIPPSKPLSDLLFEGVDALSRLLDGIAGGEAIAQAPEAICQKLEQAAAGHIAPAPPPSETAIPARQQATKDRNEAQTEPVSPPSPAGQDSRLPETVEYSPQRSEAAAHPPAPSPAPNGPLLSKSARTIRINADKLDELIKLMGEIVSARRQSFQRLKEIRGFETLARQAMMLTADDADSENSRSRELSRLTTALYQHISSCTARFREDLSHRKRLTDELQDQSIALRMMPLSTIFDALPRAVRDISEQYGKSVDLTVEGGETELDKKIIEKIADPLLHMIRNSIDHGIESPETRRQGGKPDRGTIRLSASYDGSNVLVRLHDDGQGIPVSRIRSKAAGKKLATADQLNAMTPGEIINLIFRPGFSTCDMITDLSGRGVGMDIVHKNIVDDLKGSVDVETHPGQGTTFNIRLPLTMAVLRVLFIRAGDLVFGVPTNFITEITRIPAPDVIQIHDKKAVRLRDQILPVIRLGEVLRLPGDIPAETESLLILVVSLGSEQLGVVIDALLNEDDVVIKPLPAHMKDIGWISGCIISGNNKIINVLHMPKILEAAREIKSRKHSGEQKKTPEADGNDSLQILLVDDSVSTREIEKSILESYGYAVTLAGDGAEGLEKARRFKYDLVITDVEMPRMNGFSLTAQLRADEAYRETPVILVTSLDSESDKHRGIEVGADAYILKGDFDQSDLLDTIRSLVG
ncbi:hybrid sensor histidine kinase/response regulato r [Desulfonema ishimotonii]|uniref:Chemotaxis protein CheA n=1 Tax=Desulfonema ishimotonii TaxID=45657 RepID=A0A401FT26_9BACT|nr:hybrid sensor histidine kinase/response regulator [Desulfonema ishimotonii]GBC60119.1 hybrid sensor histidine kinase/response regulato r [Desulfonema ishimotonii]